MTHYRIQRQDGTWTNAERVTTILRRGMPSPALEAWKFHQLAEWCQRNPQGFPTGATAVARWEGESQGPANRGTRVHRIIASRLRTVTLPVEDEDRMHLAAFDSWWEAGGWKLDDVTHVEQCLLSSDGKVAGTADLILRDRLLVDWKTATEPGPCWPNHRAQLGGYASMTTLVDDGKIRRVSYPMPQITEARIVQLCANGQWNETRLEGEELRNAQEMWCAVRVVAEANGV